MAGSGSSKLGTVCLRRARFTQSGRSVGITARSQCTPRKSRLTTRSTLSLTGRSARRGSAPTTWSGSRPVPPVCGVDGQANARGRATQGAPEDALTRGIAPRVDVGQVGAERVVDDAGRRAVRNPCAPQASSRRHPSLWELDNAQHPQPVRLGVLLLACDGEPAARSLGRGEGPLPSPPVSGSE